MDYTKTIYKLDSENRLRFLTIEAVGADVIQKSGIVNSENSISHTYTCTAKNIGRANETTPEEQAILEAMSKIEDKLSQGYFVTQDAARRGNVVLPMLAKNYKDESKKIDWSKPVYAQPKLDGMRALGTSHQMMISRQGKVIETMGHIQEELDLLNCHITFDGELYSHGRNFQENMRLIKKDRGAETKEIKYRVYDMVMCDVPFYARYKHLQELCNTTLKHIEIVPTFPIHNEEDLKRIHKKFLAQGYEGTIIRHSDAGYAINKRDTQLLKYKDFIDIACRVIDVIPSDKNPKQGIVQCVIPTGTFGCGMKFSHTEREEILENKEKYIGKMAEVRFFEYSEDGIPRFPVCHGFREDK